MDQVSFYASIGWTIYALAAGFHGQSGQGEGKSIGNSWENHGTVQVFSWAIHVTIREIMGKSMGTQNGTSRGHVPSKQELRYIGNESLDSILGQVEILTTTMATKKTE